MASEANAHAQGWIGLAAIDHMAERLASRRAPPGLRRSRPAARDSRCAGPPRVVLKTRDSLPLEPLDEIKLWVDANLASRLGGGVKRVHRGAGGSGWAQTHVLELKGGGKLFAKVARMASLSVPLPPPPSPPLRV